MRKAIVDYIRELSIVIVGITVAFAINKWSERNQNHEKEKHVMETVLSEIENNNFYVKEAILANEKVISQYDSALMLLETVGDRPINIIINVSKLLFEETGMELAVSIGVLSEVDFQLARDISFCYKLQQNILDFEETYFDYLDVDEEDRKRYYRRCKSKVSNFTNALKTLDEDQVELRKEVEKYIQEKF